MLQHRAHFRLPEVPEVSRIINREKMRPASMWHTDHTNASLRRKRRSFTHENFHAKAGYLFADMYAGLISCRLRAAPTSTI